MPETGGSPKLLALAYSGKSTTLLSRKTTMANNRDKLIYFFADNYFLQLKDL
jgi:hypothetical protein